MGQTFSVLITDRFDVDALASLKGDPKLRVLISNSPLPNKTELLEADGLIIRSRTKIDDALLSQAPNLKVIVTATSGFDHIDFTATQNRNLLVMHTPEANAASAAELTWALVLACCRRIPEAHRAIKAGEWRREALIGHQLEGKTYGIVGLGRIGSRVARMARAFGMKAIAYDPYQEDMQYQREQVTRVSLDELLKLADVMSFHVPATEETFHMLNATTLEHMNHGAIFVNTSRGTIITEADLVTAIEQGWIGACGLDVFEREPLPRNSALHQLPNVVMTPHIGATTSEAFHRASLEAAQKIRTFVASGSSSDRLPPEAPWHTSRP